MWTLYLLYITHIAITNGLCVDYLDCSELETSGWVTLNNAALVMCLVQERGGAWLIVVVVVVVDVMVTCGGNGYLWQWRIWLFVVVVVMFSCSSGGGYGYLW